MEKSVYVPPSNVLSPEGRAVLTHEIPEVKTIASTYFPGDFAYAQEFEWAADGMFEQPRVISGGDNWWFYAISGFLWAESALR